jgi:hypothetical protein
MAAFVFVTVENTTTLIDVQHQAAATAASVKDARTYMATVVKTPTGKPTLRKYPPFWTRPCGRIAQP